MAGKPFFESGFGAADGSGGLLFTVAFPVSAS